MDPLSITIIVFAVIFVFIIFKSNSRVNTRRHASIKLSARLEQIMSIVAELEAESFTGGASPYLRDHNWGSDKHIIRLLSGFDVESFYAIFPDKLVELQDCFDYHGFRVRMVDQAPSLIHGHFVSGDVCNNKIILLSRELTPLVCVEKDGDVCGCLKIDYCAPISLLSIAFVADINEKIIGVMAIGKNGQLLFGEWSNKYIVFHYIKSDASCESPKAIFCWRSLVMIINKNDNLVVGRLVNVTRLDIKIRKIFIENNPIFVDKPVSGIGRIMIKEKWYCWVGTTDGGLYIAEAGIFWNIHKATLPSDIAAQPPYGLTDVVVHKGRVVIRFNGRFFHFRRGNAEEQREDAE